MFTTRAQGFVTGSGGARGARKCCQEHDNGELLLHVWPTMP